MKRPGRWIIRTYLCGGVGEKIKYFLPEGTGTEARETERDRRAAERAEKKAEGAQIRRLARIINANWPGGSGVLIGLDYDEKRMQRILGKEDPENPDGLLIAAEGELRNCLRRVKRRMGEEDELRYVAVTSDMDGDTGESVRVHHHLIIDAECRDAFIEAWGAASVDYERMNERQEDYTRLAAYMLRQVRRRPEARRYMCSRNLIRPEPRDRVVMSAAQLRVPKGYRLVEGSTWGDGAFQYIRYVKNLSEEDGYDGGRKKAGGAPGGGRKGKSRGRPHGRQGEPGV